MLPLSISKFRTALAFFACCSTATVPGCSDDAGGTPSEVATVTPEIIRSFPHDSTAFTQGLFYADGKLYESTGAPNQRISSLRVIDPASGTVLRSEPNPNVFAEGLALLDYQVVQLTWRNGVALRYLFPSLTPNGMFRYDGEGWGLTSDSRHFIMSNGSDSLFFRDISFRIVRRIGVKLRGKPLTQLNELEYANDLIYANVWHSTFVFEIDPETGTVIRMVDCSALAEKAVQSNPTRVLNGIAYRPETGTFFLTGKDWPLMFEVRLPR